MPLECCGWLNVTHLMDGTLRWVNNFLTCKRSAPPHRYVCINNKYRFGCVTCSPMALHVAHGMSYVYFCAVDRWSMCLSQHLLFLLATARKFICANCTREWLPCDRQPVGLVWSISIGRNLNVISHKSQRLIAVVVGNLPRMQPKIYNNHNSGHKCRSSAFDENRSCVHATTHQMQNQMRYEKDTSGTEPSPFRFHLLWKSNQQNFSAFVFICLWVCVLFMCLDASLTLVSTGNLHVWVHNVRSPNINPWMELKIAQRSNKNWLDSCSFANSRFISSDEAFTRSQCIVFDGRRRDHRRGNAKPHCARITIQNANSSNDSHAKWNRMNAADENIFI